MEKFIFRQRWLFIVGLVVTAFGVLLAVLVRKTPESRKPLTAEDFLGGVLVGSIAGMFSSRLIALFETILTG